MKCKANMTVLKNTMLESGLSYKDLTNKAKCSSTTVAKVLNGGFIQSRTAKRLANALEKPVTELFIVE